MSDTPHTEEASAEQQRKQHHEQKLEQHAAATDALSRVNGALELQAALLAPGGFEQRLAHRERLAPHA